MSHTLEEFTGALVSQLEIAYNTYDPIARSNAIQQVEGLQSCEQTGISPKELVAAGIRILQRPDISLPCRAYGAVILQTALLRYGEFGSVPQLCGSISVDDTHFEDIINWIVGADDQDNCYAGRMSQPMQVTGEMAACSIHKVVVSSSSQLIATAASLYWPNSGQNLINILCGNGGSILANRRNTQRLLLEFCRSCCEPSYSTLPKIRIGKLRAAISSASPTILKTVVEALERQYVYVREVTGGNQAGSSETLAVQAVCDDMSCCLETLSLAIRTSKQMLQALWDANVCEALGALIQLSDETTSKVPLLALDACVAIIGNLSKDALLPKELPPTHGNDIQRLCNFCVNVIQTLPRFVEMKDFDSAARIVEIIAKSASLKTIITAAKSYQCEGSLLQAVLGSACLALQIPNVMLATDICESLVDLLCSATDNGVPSQAQLIGFDPEKCLMNLTRLSIRDHFNAWIPFVPRNNPQDTEYQKQGRNLSELIFDNSEAFMAAHSQLRSAMAPLLAVIGSVYPAVSQQFIAYLLGLVYPAAPNEPTTRTGNVTQRSATYATWESTEFLINCALVPSAYSTINPDNDQQTESWICSLLNKHKALLQAADATLAPAYLNTYHHFWSLCLPSSESVFSGVPKRALSLMNTSFKTLSEATTMQVATEAVEILFYFMRLAPVTGVSITADPDLVSARKRGMTLLIRFSSTYVPGICNVFAVSGSKIVQLIKFETQRSLVTDLVLPSERSLLNEALAGLTNVMNNDDAEGSIRQLLGPTVEVLTSFGNSVDGPTLGRLLSDETRNGQAQRESLRDSVSTMTAVLRRSAVTEFTTSVAATVIPLLGSITITVHSLDESHLPPQYVSILDPTDDEQKMAMINGSGVRLPPDLNNKVGASKRYLAALRIALYQGVALLPRFLPITNFVDGVSSILVGAHNFPTPIMRDLCHQCLFTVSTECPPLVGISLRTIQAFLQNLGTNRATEAQQIVDTKQIAYFSKDIATYIRGAMIEGKSYQEVLKGPPLDGPSYQSNATAMLAAPESALLFLSNEEGLDLYVSSVSSLLVFGGDIRSAAYLAILGINEMLRRSPETFGNAALILFAISTASVVTNKSVDRQATKEYLLSMLSDLYVHFFPFFAAALTYSDNELLSHALKGGRYIADTADVESLHAQLMTVKGPRQKRQSFVDFIGRILARLQ